MSNMSEIEPKSGDLNQPQPKTLTISKKEGEEEIVIGDECGDTLWDKVLAQEEKEQLIKMKTPDKE